jgi:hypothetical protein
LVESLPVISAPHDTPFGDAAGWLQKIGKGASLALGK